MIKLKDLLKESYAWERKFGEKLPTLADVQKKKLTEASGGGKEKVYLLNGMLWFSYSPNSGRNNC